VVPTQAPAMLVLRQPSELSARKGRKSPCVLGRENQQKNKWACVCHPDPENRPRGRAFHDPGCIRGHRAMDGTLSFVRGHAPGTSFGTRASGGCPTRTARC
jgi:hypothetical protein